MIIFKDSINDDVFVGTLVEKDIIESIISVFDEKEDEKTIVC